MNGDRVRGSDAEAVIKTFIGDQPLVCEGNRFVVEQADGSFEGVVILNAASPIVKAFVESPTFKGPAFYFARLQGFESIPAACDRIVKLCRTWFPEGGALWATTQVIRRTG